MDVLLPILPDFTTDLEVQGASTGESSHRVGAKIGKSRNGEGEKVEGIIRREMVMDEKTSEDGSETTDDVNF